MTVEKGKAWGTPGAVLPDDAVVVRTDADARRALEAARHERRPFPVLGLLGGDLCRTLGGGDDEGRLRSGEAVRFTVDVGEVLLDGRLHLFVAHLVARNRLWTRAFVAMNAQWLGAWNLGPRAHPGDGLLDTYDATLAVGQLGAVRSRLHHGTHLPHPGIEERRTPSIQLTLARPLPVRLDGDDVGKSRNLAVRVEPDALTVIA